MSAETEILAEVDTLKAKFTDTKVLYREVCVLLFFRHGITPTTNKLYQYVRKGTMATPADALAAFWEDLRLRARVEIDHPDLPDEIKALAAEAIAGLWGQATAAARNELAASRLESQAIGERAQTAQNAAEQAAQEAKATAAQLRLGLAECEAALENSRTALEAERRVHAATQARAQELQAQVEQARAQHQRQQEAFSADLARAQEAVEAAQERAAASERHALLEIDQERQARTKADRVSEAAREKLAEAEVRERRSAMEQAQTIARLEVEVKTANAALLRATDNKAALERHAEMLQRQLLDSQHAAARFQAEAHTLQGLIDRLTPAPAAEPVVGPAPETPRPRRRRAPKEA